MRVALVKNQEGLSVSEELTSAVKQQGTWRK